MQTPVRFHPYTGGVENYAYDLSKRLAARGHEVTVICADETGGGTKEEIPENLRVKRLPYAGKIANTNITPGLPLSLLKEDCDVIHTHFPTPWSADWSGIISLMNRKPFFITYCNDLTGNGSMRHVASAYSRTVLRATLRASKKIITLQPRYAEYSSYLRGYAGKIEAIPPGVDTGKFLPSASDKEKGDPTIFFLSILDEYHAYKGLDHLLKAVAIVRREIPDVRLIVGGKGKMASSYNTLSKDLGIEENVAFIGFVPDGDLVRLYNNCDVFALPSTAHQEGFGIVLAEAMSCAVPVITTDYAGLADEIKDAKAGVVVPACDAASLAEGIMQILSDKREADIMGRRGRTLVKERYEWDKIAGRVERLYEEHVV